ncbi:hypothetical protein VP01_2790g2 [Puccinia sorghi]|uniref:Uncharacterized protein n=1 Tax=Puccinia sorghi TaxID=27349 RepID=A0A0L6V3C3_9BASI|nr:hypothetical protein VP01_2790g2 [Puccinia sorghi]
MMRKVLSNGFDVDLRKREFKFQQRGLKSFDRWKDTPVKIFHVFLLGTVKYLVNDLISSTRDQKIQLQAYCLIGKYFKLIIQEAPFVFFPLINQEERRLWFSLF